MILMFYSTGLVGGPAPKPYQCVPSSIRLAFPSKQYLNTWRSAAHSVTENMQTATREGTQSGDLHN